MLPEPVLILENGDIYAGIFLCAVINCGIIGASKLMIATTAFNVIKKIFYVFAFVGSLSCWTGLALDASQYEWFKWYDGFLFPIHVLVTPGYYMDASAILSLVLPSVAMVVCLAMSVTGLIRCIQKINPIVENDPKVP